MQITLCFLALSVCFLVGETDAALCKDDHRYNCKFLDINFGVCSRNPKVKESCRQTCNLCPMDGHWSNWSDWSSCNVTCGGGVQTRTRQCDNPAPVKGGLSCDGDNIETQTCNSDACSVHGGWDDWSDWESCSVTCGGGLKKRRRTCTNPAPSSFGRQCAGNDEDKDRCNDFACEGDDVAFHAYNGRLAPSRHGGTVIFPKVLVGESYYNKATGVFTAPVAGMYTLTAHVCDKAGLILHIRINNFNFAKSRVYSSANIQCSSATGTTKLKKGDRVTVVTDAQVIYDSGTYFTGHLLHSYE